MICGFSSKLYAREDDNEGVASGSVGSGLDTEILEKAAADDPLRSEQSAYTTRVLGIP